VEGDAEVEIITIRKAKDEAEETGEAEVEAREGVEVKEEAKDGVEDGVVEEAEDERKVGNEVALEEEGAGDPTMPELRANQNGRLILS
jgi:hypothetical protein